MQELSASRNFLSSEIGQHLNILNEIYTKYSNTQKGTITKVCDVMVANNLLDVFVRMWDFYEQNTDEHPNEQNDNESNLLKMKKVFWSYSNNCEDLGKAVHKHKMVIERIMREFDFEFNFEHIFANLNILHHCVRMYEKNKDLIREDNGIEKLAKYKNSNHLLVKAEAFIVLAYCINEDEDDKITTSTEVIHFLKYLLASAMVAETHTKFGFSALETTAALKKLAQNDDNKKTIVESEVLPALTKMLDTRRCSNNEVNESVSCIWSLAFHADNRKPIIEEPRLVDLIKQIQKDKSAKPQLRGACSSVLFVLGLEKNPESKNANDNPHHKHIMLSYNWDVQDTILQLRDFLTEQGHNVWMDVDKMQDSILSGMAEAVENSLIIVVAVTEAYKNSNSCRTEAEYSYKRRVPLLPLLLEEGYNADGWLGAMIGTKLYVDLTSGDREKKLVEVQKQLSNQLNLTVDKAVVPVKISDEGRSVPSRTQPLKAISTKLSTADGDPFSLVNANLPCSMWNEEDVQKWYRSIEGTENHNTLVGVNGIVLAQLCKMLIRSPESYYSSVENKLHLSFKDSLLFTHSIERLMLNSM